MRRVAFPHSYLIVKLQGVCDISSNLKKYQDQLFSGQKDVPRHAHWPIQPRTLKRTLNNQTNLDFLLLTVQE